MSKVKEFTAPNGNVLIVRKERSAVVFEMPDVYTRQAQQSHNTLYNFDKELLAELTTHLEKIALDTWQTFSPRDADSEASDYYEYYDKELDLNGYAFMRANGFEIERPSLLNKRAYRFNKRKMETFVYDLQKRGL